MKSGQGGKKDMRLLPLGGFSDAQSESVAKECLKVPLENLARQLIKFSSHFPPGFKYPRLSSYALQKQNETLR